MNNFSKISEALKYIDNHIDESINLNMLSDKFFFSPYYFHRLFSVIVGKSLAAYIRDRRIIYACEQLSSTERCILDIALDVGFNSAQAFSRAFREVQGLSPSDYRKYGYQPVIMTVDELIMKFTNRLKGGILVKPNIINNDKIIIAGTYGDGSQTADIWNSFIKLTDEKPLVNALSRNGYEVRTFDGEKSIVYVGYPVSDKGVDPSYTIFEIPASKYASFDVYVANGYESENNAMNEWLTTNDQGYTEKLMDEKTHFCVEYYDERFNGDESDSIVEIWIPIEKK